ncbi:hypothetical protein ABEB36_007745 [Hypothenemus hampei]|uniref:C2H2-type domain-containing protein n=1 Tax=Hypothenemus hampei TaxID=57062 RepID=A0ABD1EV85_HYPHA
MSKKNSDKFCCACLSNSVNLFKLSRRDDNKVTLYTKLKICISEIGWSTSYKICDKCTNLLDISYTFRQTCLKSEFVRQKGDCDEEEVGSIKTEIENDEMEKEGSASNQVKEKLEVVKNETTDDDLVSEDEPNYIDPYNGYLNFHHRRTKIEAQTKKKRKNVEFFCEKCNNSYNSSIKLVNHCIKDHGMKKIDVRPFICDRCSSRFCNSSNLLQHMKYHEAVRSNMCTYCGKGFITKTDLNIHEKQHLNKREYRCEECGKCFNTHKDIRSHRLVVHTDSTNWKYSCSICNKPFPIKSNYDSHMRRHAGVRKFECHLCQRKFTDKCVLQRHMKTHSNVREHKCMHCEREYKDPRVLKVHMAKIHGIGVGEIKMPSREKKYICHICPKSYYAKNKLTRHLYTHSGEKPYDCPVCGKKFNDKSYVKQHLRKTHNMDDVKEEEITRNNVNTLSQGILCVTDRNINF